MFFVRYFAPAVMRSIVIIVSVCLFVCLFAYVFQIPRVNFTRFSVHFIGRDSSSPLNFTFVFNIAIFVLKGDVKLQLTN